MELPSSVNTTFFRVNLYVAAILDIVEITLGIFYLPAFG